MSGNPLETGSVLISAEKVSMMAHVAGLSGLAEYLNTSEAALRLLISILLGFPIALFHRYTLYGKNAALQHIFFVLCGVAIGCWNYGFNILHSASALFGSYLILMIFGSTSRMVLINFLFNMIYLLYGYYTTSTEDYDIKWTMPHCVLTLRLIGLGFNIWDGRRQEEKLSEYQKQISLKQRPSFLEVAAFTYFPGSFLVGPQFSMRRYLDFVNCRLINDDKKQGRELPDCLLPSMKRALLGVLYIILFQIGTSLLPDQYLLSQEFNNMNLIYRMFLIGIWGHVSLYKYISCWLLTEGVCTNFGLTYNKKSKDGEVQWDGCANVKLMTFENAIRFNDYISSFNTNTNHWCAEYIYKRLKFMGSKVLSQFVTLMFLAIWHGFHTGYYHCFLMEFLVMFTERNALSYLEKKEYLLGLLKNHSILRFLFWVFLKIYTYLFLGYCLVPFFFLSFHRYHKVFSSVYYYGHVIFLTYPVITIIRMLVSPRKSKKMTE